VSIPPADRQASPADRQASPADRQASPADRQAAISPSRAAFVARLAGLVRQGGAVLDAACGTGTYWPALLAAGLQVTGVDQSPAMLAQARREHPEVPSRVLALQDLAELPDRFDALLCVDALQNVAPEDWLIVAIALAAVLKDQAPAYVTVKLPDGRDHPYPPRDQVRRWLAAAGFAVTDEADADHCWHLLLARTTDR
jgi:SAM-dependent methyltransferase